MLRWLSLFLGCAVICISQSCDVEDERPKVTLPHGGSLVGSKMDSLNGKPIRAFRGIPFAEPPIRRLRFKAPIPAKPWCGEKLADKDGSSCISPNPFSRSLDISGDEDCLYLNVFAPAINATEKPLSVMVYFYGGGFVTGTSDSAILGPQRLLDHDVIFVTGNYRVGAMGFLSSGTLDAPGNNGLKDQLLILKWVQDNIKAFGGNPDDVTIFGESAGGASVGLHIYSPLSKGLFHKAILQSGSSFDPWAVGNITVVQNRTSIIAETLGCSMCKNNWKATLACLRAMPAESILSTYKRIFDYDFEPAVPFPPVVEPSHEGAFLPKHPKDYVVPPSVDVPVIIGITSGEGILKSAPILNNIKDKFTARFDQVLPIYLFYNSKPVSVQKKLTELIDKFYFKEIHDWSKENSFNLTNVITDSFFLWGQDRFLRHRFAAAEKASVGATYYYLYDHRGPISMSVPLGGGNEYYGVCHADELAYLFWNDYYGTQGDENDNKMKWALPYMWTNFAKTGNPTPNNSEIPAWSPADGFPLRYAHLGRQTTEDWTILSNEVGLYEDRVEFWRNIESQYWN